MDHKIQEIKIYLLGRKIPKIIRDTISGFHDQVHVNVPKSNNWRPLHRDDGAAVEYEDGGFEYWNNGQLHRTDGPALYHPESGIEEYYVNGGLLSRSIFFSLQKAFLESSKYAELQANKYTGTYDLEHARIILKNGILHSEHEPAVIIRENNYQLWFVDGVLHRLDGPAVVKPNYAKEFWLYGRRRRAHKLAPIAYGVDQDDTKWAIGNEELDLPEFVDYIKNTYLPEEVCIEEDRLTFVKDGLAHSVDGPAIIWFNGSLEWRNEGKLHRTNGPAIVSSNGTKMWYKDGKRHRVDGPAIEFPSKRKAWYIDGVRTKRRDYQNKANEYIEKELVLKSVEELLTNVNSFNINDIHSPELNNYLNEVDEVFNKMLNLDVNIEDLKEDILKDFPEELNKDIDHEAIKPNTVAPIDDSWILPIASVAIASILSIFKTKKVKPKKQLVVSEEVIKETVFEK